MCQQNLAEESDWKSLLEESDHSPRRQTVAPNGHNRFVSASRLHVEVIRRFGRRLSRTGTLMHWSYASFPLSRRYVSFVDMEAVLIYIYCNYLYNLIYRQHRLCCLSDGVT